MVKSAQRQQLYAKAAGKAVKKTAKKVAVAAKKVNVRKAISTAADFIPVVGNAKAAGKGGKAAVRYYSGSKKTAAPKKAPTTGYKKAAAAPAKPAAPPTHNLKPTVKREPNGMGEHIDAFRKKPADPLKEVLGHGK
ncbi:hypothetical protein [Lysinibacillus sphaericus]|uniref:hypothetical protein n=1 Tax=Lysinibacillus sphaericus TaxID=1421 RepID=UPI0019D5CCA6|nr:hypothetical protein [Lysinibacillus sphaericus]